MNGNSQTSLNIMIDWTTVVVAILGICGGSIGAILAYRQFMIKRKDDLQEKEINKLISDAVEQVKKELQDEFNHGLIMRGQEGAERFKINSDQIKDNTEAIKEMIIMQKKSDIKFDKLANSIDSLTTVSKACAEGVRSTLYDKICLVANRAIPRKSITTDEKANIIQLFKSYTELNGNGRAHVLYEECMKLPLIDDSENIN